MAILKLASRHTLLHPSVGPESNKGSSDQIAAPIELSALLPISHGGGAHWPKAVELLSNNVMWARALKCHRRRWVRRRIRLGRLGCLLRYGGPLKSVELLLFPDVHLVVLRGRIHVIQFAVVLHRRNLVVGKPSDRLLLLRSRDGYDFKPRLREQGLGLRCACLAAAGCLTC